MPTLRCDGVEAFEVAMIGGAVRRGLVRGAGGALGDETALLPLQPDLLTDWPIVKLLHFQNAPGTALIVRNCLKGTSNNDDFVVRYPATVA
jgi:hypothetical protein